VYGFGFAGRTRSFERRVAVAFSQEAAHVRVPPLGRGAVTFRKEAEIPLNERACGDKDPHGTICGHKKRCGGSKLGPRYNGFRTRLAGAFRYLAS